MISTLNKIKTIVFFFFRNEESVCELRNSVSGCVCSWILLPQGETEFPVKCVFALLFSLFDGEEESELSRWKIDS